MSSMKYGSVSRSLPIQLRKTVDSTEETGILAAGVMAYYTCQGAAPVQITPIALLSGPSAAFVAGGWWEYDAVNVRGLYRFDAPNAMWAAGPDWVVLTIQIAAGFSYVEKFDLVAQTASDAYALVGGVPAAVLASPVETGLTLQQALQYIASREVGNLDKANTQFKAANNPGINRVKYAIDSLGNRTIVLT